MLKKIVRAKAFTLIIFLLILFIVFSIWSSANGGSFFNATTIKNILQSIIVTSFLTIGAGCLMITGNLDISASSIGCFGGVVLAVGMKQGWNLILAIVVALVLSAFIGFLNGFLVTKFKFPAFITTLGMSSVAKGLSELYSGIVNNGTATNVNFKNAVIKYLGTGKILGLPVGIYIMIVFFIVYGILISKTRFGTKMCLVGGNPVAAELAGINSSKIIILMFINSGVMACISGIFNGARLQQAALTALATSQFSGLTAAILGGISFGGGAGGMGGAFIGLLILNTFQIGMQVNNVNAYWVTVFSGILLLVALAVDFIQMSARNKTKKA